jgi:phospholipid transport system substrate-binding protein
MNMKRYGIILMLAMMLSGGFAVAAESDKPDQQLEQNVGKVFDALQENGGAIRKQPEKLRKVVDGLVLPLIDFEAMSKLTLAKHWKNASDNQRVDFVSAYREMLVRTYTNSLAQYASENIKFFPERTKLEGEYATVYSEFVPGNGQPNKQVKYSMRRNDGQWMVYDITIDGLSFIKNYRTSFSKEIQDKGLDSLIQRLQAGESFG